MAEIIDDDRPQRRWMVSPVVLSQDQMTSLRDRLTRELDETNAEINEISEQVRTYLEGQDNNYGVDNHLGDQADVVYEEERLLSVRERLTDRKVLIEQALTKMDRGTYGICENCHQPIAPDRLAALPFATLCISCQEKRDRHREAGG